MDFLSAIFFGVRGIDAVAAFEAAPRNPSATFYRKAALCFFLVGATLLLTAALVDVLANARAIGEVFGWSGIGCVQVSVLCGLRYSVVNRRADAAEWE
ncbi:MAG TPA: hypothetical protein VG055_29260 [Planctomycetaceae bacterium]|jgi:hypothetical protein|nr:hypothetical protein [Planctomycetaceae bacterium]